jgi:hypothetical protein
MDRDGYADIRHRLDGAVFISDREGLGEAGSVTRADPSSRLPDRTDGSGSADNAQFEKSVSRSR